LLQAAKGGGLGGFLTGTAETTLGVRGTATFLHKITVALAILFMLSSLSLAFVNSKQVARAESGDSVVDETLPAEQKEPAPDAEAATEPQAEETATEPQAEETEAQPSDQETGEQTPAVTTEQPADAATPADTGTPATAEQTEQPQPREQETETGAGDSPQAPGEDAEPK